MATFTDVYKQELKSRGVLSSLSSTMFKRSKERLDPRNILFGGSGITSAIGQKIFGKGYSALNKSSSGKSLGDSGMQSQALNALIISSKTQEAQLSIIAKNSMNNNAMARDMNVMRQNIMKLVTISGGKASRGSDMFFKDAAARESAYESQFGKSRSISKSVSPVAISADPKKDGGGLLSTLVKAVGAISVAILALGTKLVTELGGIITAAIQTLGAVIKSAIETLGNVLRGALLGKALGGGGGGGPVGGGRKGGGKGKFSFGVGTGIAGILAGLGIYFSDEIIDFIDKKLIDTGLKDPSVEDSLDPNEQIVGDKSTKQTIKDYAKPVGTAALAGATAVGASKFISSKSAVQGYNQKAGRFVGSTGKFVSAAETPAGKLIDKLFKFGAKLSSKPGLMSKFLGLVATKIGGSLALKISTFFGGLVVPGPGWIISLLAAGLLVADVYAIYNAIFGVGGIAELLDEDEKAEKKSDVSPTPVKSDEQIRLGMMADAARASGASSSPPSSEPSKVTFAGLSKEQQDVVLKKQREKEGFYPGSLTHDLNNPGAMLYSDRAAKFGGVLDTTGRGVGNLKGKFAKFPTLEQGTEAQRSLWLSSGYANLPLDQAINRWTTGKLEGTGDPGVENYKKGIFAALGKSQPPITGNTLSKESTTVASAMRESSSQPSVIAFSAPQTINNGGSSAAPQTVAAATNIDALELFFQAATGVRPV
jgi:hypothetical protein